MGGASQTPVDDAMMRDDQHEQQRHAGRAEQRDEDLIEAADALLFGFAASLGIEQAAKIGVKCRARGGRGFHRSRADEASRRATVNGGGARREAAKTEKSTVYPSPSRTPSPRERVRVRGRVLLRRGAAAGAGQGAGTRPRTRSQSASRAGHVDSTGSPGARPTPCFPC